jgi:hypothetical protein
MTTTRTVLDARATGHRTHDRAGARSLGARASAFYDDLVLLTTHAGDVDTTDMNLVVFGIASVLAIVLLWSSQG